MKSTLYFATQAEVEDFALPESEVGECLTEAVFFSNNCLQSEETILELIDKIDIHDIDKRYPINVFEVEIEYSLKVKQVGSIETGVRFVPDKVQPSTPIKKTARKPARKKPK